jgi:hypothetical protein
MSNQSLTQFEKHHKPVDGEPCIQRLHARRCPGDYCQEHKVPGTHRGSLWRNRSGPQRLIYVSHAERPNVARIAAYCLAHGLQYEIDYCASWVTLGGSLIIVRRAVD